MKKKNLIKSNSENTRMKEEETVHPDDGLQATGPKRQGEELTDNDPPGKKPTPARKKRSAGH